MHKSPVAAASARSNGAPPDPGDTPATEQLSLSGLARQARIWQRAAWERGQWVTVEQLLAKYPTLVDDPESVVDLIFHEFLLRERSGERPTADAFMARFPRHAAALRKQIAFHVALQGPQANEPEQPDAGRRTSPDEAAAAEQTPLAALAGYEILEEIGFGGMGVLYRARQKETDRLVAIKVLSAGVHAAPAQRARFRAEAALIARLQHPNIVQIYEAAEQHGCPYLVLEYVGGGTLRDRLQGVPQSPRTAARFLERIARALEAAHAAGVVHRDLTPGNILFPSDHQSHERSPGLDAVRPKISDFGLAKVFGAEAAAEFGQRTMTGDVIGTPAYMSPEQAAGQNGAIGPASDIYSLGAILYELLTGRPPLRGVTAVETLQRVVASEPVPPSRLQLGLPADLETICLKCLQKQPAQRYARAVDLAEDLRRFLADEPILARPVGSLTRLARWCHRKPLPASLMSLVLVLLIVVVAGTITATVRLNQAARDRLAHAKLAEARVHRLDNQFGRGERSLAALADSARTHATAEVRDEAIASLAQFDLKLDHEGPAAAGFVDFSPDLQRYAHQAGTGKLVIRRVADEAEICRLNHPSSVTGALFSPDGTHVVCRWRDQSRIEVWFVGGAAPRLVLSDDCDVLWGMGAVAFSGDGRRLAVGRPDGLVRVYRLDDGTQCLEFRTSSKIGHLAFHPQLPQLAVATLANLQIHDAAEGRLLVQLDEAAGSEYLSWHPDGTFLVTSDRDGGLSIWEPSRLRRRHALPGKSGGGVVTAFNHSGSLLFSAGWDGALRIWEPYWGKLLFTSIGSNAYFLRFSSDDRFWAGDLVDGRIRFWQFPPAPAYRRLTTGATFDLGHFRTVAFSPAGAGRGRLLAVAMERGVGFWDLRSGRAAGHLPIGITSDLAFDQTGNLLTADAGGVQFWPIRESATSAGSLQIGPPERVTRAGTASQIAASANGKVLALSRRNEGAFVVHRAAESDPVRLTATAPHDDVRAIAMTPDGALVATACLNGALVRVWDAQSGEIHGELPLGSSRVAFSPDGRKLLTTARGLELWSVGNWQRLWQGAGTPLSAHGFSPDGRFIAVDSGTGQIVLYAAEDGRVIARLNDPYPATLHALAIGPGGRWLAGVARDLQQLFVWNLDSVACSLADLGITSELASPDAPDIVPVNSLALEIRLEDAKQRLLDELAQIQKELPGRPQDGMLQLEFGRLLARLGRDSEARLALLAARASGALHAATLELAACEVRLEQWAEAEAVLEQALAAPSISPSQAGPLCNALAWYLSLAPPEFRNPRRALECAHRALELQPGNVACVNTLGLAFYRERELPLAIEALKLSLRSSSHPVFDLCGLALCHQSAGDARLAADFAGRAEYLFETHGSEWSRQERIEFQWLREEYLRGAEPPDH